MVVPLHRVFVNSSQFFKLIPGCCIEIGHVRFLSPPFLVYFHIIIQCQWSKTDLSVCL
jgi:hypothetical protein